MPQWGFLLVGNPGRGFRNLGHINQPVVGLQNGLTMAYHINPTTFCWLISHRFGFHALSHVGLAAVVSNVQPALATWLGATPRLRARPEHLRAGQRADIDFGDVRLQMFFCKANWKWLPFTKTCRRTFGRTQKGISSIFHPQSWNYQPSSPNNTLMTPSTLQDHHETVFKNMKISEHLKKKPRD